MNASNLSFLIGRHGLYIETESERYISVGPVETLPHVYENITVTYRRITQDVLMGFQPWIITAYNDKLLVLGVGRYFSYMYLNATPTRNVYVDWQGNIWAPVKSGCHIMVILADQEPHECDFHPNTVLVNVSRIDGGRCCLGPREGDYIYVLTTSEEGNWTQAIWKIHVPPQDEWDRELVAVFGYMARPYDAVWDGYNNQFIVPSYEWYDPYGYVCYTVDKNGNYQSIWNTSRPLQQIARDKDGNYWINCRGQKWIAVRTPNLDNVTWISSDPWSMEFRGIGENIYGDIVAANMGGRYSMIFLADDNYENKRLIDVGHKTYKAAPAGEGVFLSGQSSNRVSLIYPSYGTFIDFDVGKRVYGQGDCGLSRWKVWGWNWSPKTDTIYKWVLGYVPENVS